MKLVKKKVNQFTKIIKDSFFSTGFRGGSYKGIQRNYIPLILYGYQEESDINARTKIKENNKI